jgi:cytochrome c-type biogenesis protein CcmH/NrfG
VEAARTEANTSLRLKPNPEAYLVLARLDLRENKPESASESVTKALELDPKSASALSVQRMVAARTQPSH